MQSDFFTGDGSAAATQRLISDLTGFTAAKTASFGFDAAPDGENLYVWKVELFDFEKDSLLAKDLEAYVRVRARRLGAG
jgi:hypothetical protein